MQTRAAEPDVIEFGNRGIGVDYAHHSTQQDPSPGARQWRLWQPRSIYLALVLPKVCYSHPREKGDAQQNPGKQVVMLVGIQPAHRPGVTVNRRQSQFPADA